MGTLKEISREKVVASFRIKYLNLLIHAIWSQCTFLLAVSAIDLWDHQRLLLSEW